MLIWIESPFGEVSPNSIFLKTYLKLMYKHLLYVEYILLVVYNATEYPDRIQNQNYNCLLNFQILNIYFRFIL